MSTSLFQRQRYGRSVFLHDRKAVAHVVIKYGRISGQMTLIGAEEPASHHCHVCKKTMALRRGLMPHAPISRKIRGILKTFADFRPVFSHIFVLRQTDFRRIKMLGTAIFVKLPRRFKKRSIKPIAAAAIVS